MLNHLPILIIILPLAVAFIVLLFRKNIILCSCTSIISSFIMLLTLIPSILNGHLIRYQIGGWEGVLGINLIIDGLSFFFSFTILLVGLMTILYSIPEKKHDHTYYFLLLLLISSMIGTIFTADIFNMYILYDLVTIATYLLIAYYQQGVAIRASFNYLLMSAVGLSMFLLGVGSLYAMTGTLQISSISEQLPAIYYHNPKILIISLSLVITSMGIKMAMFPLHSWLPDAHSLAPSPISAILSGVVVKVGIYCLIRLLYNLFKVGEYIFFLSSHQVLMMLGAVTLLFGAVMALVQDDLKRMLAYSTVVQIGVILIGMSINNYTGFEGALFHVLNHALLKSALFFCAGMIILETGTRKIQNLTGYSGKNPLVAFCFVVLSLGIIGIPPMNGFISKFLICLAAIETENSIFAVIIILGSIITTAYFFRVIQIFYSKPFQSNNRLEKIDFFKNQPLQSDFFRIFPICALTAVSLLLGIIPSLGISMIRPAIEILFSGIFP